MKIRFPFFIVLAICCFQVPAYSQQSRKVDSLLSLLSSRTSEIHDTTRINALNILSIEFSTNNSDTAISISTQALLLSQKIRWKVGEGISYHQLGVFNYYKANYQIALDYYFRSFAIWKEIEKSGSYSNRFVLKHQSRAMGNIGIIYKEQGNYSKSLAYYFKALKFAEQVQDNNQIAGHLCNIGIIFDERNDYSKALDYYVKALEMAEGNKNSAAKIHGNIGNIYSQKGEYIKALHYQSKALKLDEELGNKNDIAIDFLNIGDAYFSLKNYPMALNYFFKSLTITEELGNSRGTTATLTSIGNLFLRTKKYKEAEDYLQKSLKLSKTIGFLEYTSYSELYLSDMYTQMNQPAKALDHYKKHIEIRDSIFNQENTEKTVRSEMNFEFEKKQAIAVTEYKSKLEKQSAVSEERSRKQKIIIISIIAGLIIVITFSGFIFRSLRLTRKQKHIIEIKSNETEEQKRIIEEKNKDITDSINYAKYIQNAMLPNQQDILAVFPQSFVLYKPKDIVSGDFYFFHKTDNHIKSHSTNTFDSPAIFLAAADCTGHGVPGAFMSLIGAEKLKEAVLQTSDTSKILNLLNKGIKTSLRQSDSDESTRDGMDIALVRIDFADIERFGFATLHYSGANRPIWVVRKGKMEIEEIKPTKKAIGGLTENEQLFDNHQIKLMKGDSFYLFTDGYADLFGQNGKRLMTKKFKEIILDIQHKSMMDQGKHLEYFAADWRGKTDQIDDILVIGVRL